MGKNLNEIPREVFEEIATENQLLFVALLIHLIMKILKATVLIICHNKRRIEVLFIAKL